MAAQDGDIMTESGLQHQDDSVRVAGSEQQYQGGSNKQAEDGSIRTATSGLQHQNHVAMPLNFSPLFVLYE